MYTTPVAGSVESVESSRVALQRTRKRTQRTEVYQKREGSGPEIPSINDVTTIELDRRPTSDTCMREFGTQVTKRPSANQLFRRNITVTTTLVGLE